MRMISAGLRKTSFALVVVISLGVVAAFLLTGVKAVDEVTLLAFNLLLPAKKFPFLLRWNWPIRWSIVSIFAIVLVEKAPSFFGKFWLSWKRILMEAKLVMVISKEGWVELGFLTRQYINGKGKAMCVVGLPTVPVLFTFRRQVIIPIEDVEFLTNGADDLVERVVRYLISLGLLWGPPGEVKAAEERLRDRWRRKKKRKKPLKKEWKS